MRLRGHEFQAHPRLRRHQVLLHSPSAGAGEPERECRKAAACLSLESLRRSLVGFVRKPPARQPPL